MASFPIKLLNNFDNNCINNDLDKIHSFEKYLHTQQDNLLNYDNLSSKKNKIPFLRPTYPTNLKFVSYQSFNPPNKTKTCFSQSNITASYNSKNTINKNSITSYTNFNPNKRNHISIDKKILKVKEKKKNLLLKQSKETLEKFNKKEKKLKSIQDNMLKVKMKNTFNTHKQNYMKELKLKIYNLLNKGTKNICDDFEFKNTTFNLKLLDFLKGNKNMKTTINYHKNFRFDKYDNGEGHNRYKMILDIDSIKQNEDEQINILREKLNEKEKNYIKDDPTYFFQSSLKTIEFKPISLTSRLINEEKLIKSYKNFHHKGKIDHFNFDIKDIDNNSNQRSLREKLSNRVKTDFNSTLNFVCNDINKSVYNERTKTLENNKRNIPKDLHDKIIHNMMEELRVKGFKTISQEKKEFEKKNIEDYRFHNFLINNISEKKSNSLNKNNYKKLKLNEESLVGQVGQSFNYKNFNKEEIDFVNKFKEKIKSNKK